MELKQAVLLGAQERIQRLSTYLGDVEDPERWACDALHERLGELEEYAGVVVGQHEWIDGAPDFGDGVRRELVAIHRDLLDAEFVIDACNALEALP